MAVLPPLGCLFSSANRRKTLCHAELSEASIACPARAYPSRFFNSAVSAGSTSYKSPTIPYVAFSKIGAS